MKIQVNLEHIKTAVKRNSNHCMIADATQKAKPKLKYIQVDVQSIRASDLEKGIRYCWLTPPLAQLSLLNFDQGKKVTPFSFNLNAPTKKKVGWLAYHSGQTRIGRKYNKTGRKGLRLKVTRKFGIRQFSK